jgi:hypothetical protein
MARGEGAAGAPCLKVDVDNEDKRELLGRLGVVVPEGGAFKLSEPLETLLLAARVHCLDKVRRAT